jgi:hypothetical protein
MLKITPQSIVKKFARCIQGAIDNHEELILDIHPGKHRATLNTMLAVQLVFYISVFWEVFLNDILLSYLIKSPGQFSNYFENRVNQSIGDRFGLTASNMIKFSIPKKLSVKKAALLVDPKNFNISIKSTEKLTKSANDYLVPKYARLFSLDKDDAEFVDFTFAMRNYLVHRSSGSREQLKSATLSLSGVNTGLNDSLSNVDFYLKQKVNKEIRSVLIGKRMIDIANKFI